jgi:valyl-tRNA synthetase
MKDDYDHKEVEQRISKMWEAGNYFSPKIVPSKKTFSMFLVPPNASGGMHVGNVLMIAIQDILAEQETWKMFFWKVRF